MRFILTFGSLFFIFFLISNSYGNMDNLVWCIGVVFLIGCFFVYVFDAIIEGINRFVCANIIRWVIEFLQNKIGEDTIDEFHDFCVKKYSEKFGHVVNMVEKDLIITKVFFEKNKNKKD